MCLLELLLRLLLVLALSGVRITVEDTGPGYAPSDADAPHFALDNIRERLKTMCGGTLEIEPREAGGTKVTVFVPQKKD